MRIHEGQPVLHDGASLADAAAVMILLHGRGGSGEDMIGLGRQLSAGLGQIALLAPQAAGGTWYPQRFLAPLAQNEPYLSSALSVVAQTIDEVLARDIRRDRIVLIGFSQGACLSLEFAARHPHRYGGVVGLSGALIGPPEIKRQVDGSLDGTPVFLGCSDSDSHIPLESVRQSSAIFRLMHADVLERIYPDMPHTVNEDEIGAVSNILRNVLADDARH
jgi:phospholipase/carboxylesterase